MRTRRLSWTSSQAGRCTALSLRVILPAGECAAQCTGIIEAVSVAIPRPVGEVVTVAYNVSSEFPAGYDGAAILERLDRVLDPELDESVLQLGFVRSVSVRDDQAVIVLQLPTSW